MNQHTHCDYCHHDITHTIQYRPGNRKVYCSNTCATLDKFNDAPLFTHPKPLVEPHRSSEPFEREFP